MQWIFALSSVLSLSVGINAFGGSNIYSDDFMGGLFNQDTFQNLADRLRNESQTRGLTMAMMYDGKVVTASSGLASDGTETCGESAEVIPMTPQTPMLFGSITKTFTAASIMKLVEEGKLKLSDPICNYLSAKVCNHLDNANDVDVETLISHRTGFWPYFEQFETEDPVDSFGLMEDPLREYTPEDIIMWTFSESKFLPNNRSHYSNTNFILAGMIISNVTGQTTKAGLADLTQIVPENLKADIAFPESMDEWKGAHGYVGKTDSPKIFPEGCFDVYRKISLSLGQTAGNIETTSKAMAEFWYQLANGKIVSQESIENMANFRGTLNAEFRPGVWIDIQNGYGLGLQDIAKFSGLGVTDPSELDKFGGWIRGHQGNFPGYQAWAGYFRPQNQEKYPGIVSFALGTNVQNLKSPAGLDFMKAIGEGL